MKQYLSFIVLSVLSLLSFQTHSQRNDSGLSGTRSFLCAGNYIEAFNSKNKNQLSQFLVTYYEDPDVNRKIELEKMLWKKWGRIEPVRIAYDSERETIILMLASKMPDSYLIFDIKMKDNIPEKIEFFTRTGINKEEKNNSIPPDHQVLAIADRAVPVNDSIILQTVQEIAEVYDSLYYIPETGRKISEVLQSNLRKGKYDGIKKTGALADSIKKDILDCHFDLHSWVEADRLMLPRDLAGVSSQNFGFEEFKIINGDMGYVKLNEFSQSANAREYASLVLDSLSCCSILIFDLRDNFGGYPEMMELLSGYFFPVPARINTLYDRNGNIVDEIWTLDSIPGKRFDDSIPVIILTSNKTASAAEGFTDFFKRTKRAVIIGDTTSGARHPSEEIAINPLFVVSIPYLRGEESEGMEGKGIAPDIQVPAQEALKYAVKISGN